MTLTARDEKRTFSMRWTSLATIVLAASCGGSVSSSDSGGGGSGQGGSANPRCVPGTTQQCVGVGACLGGQACLPSGDGWGPCDCGIATGGTGTGGSAGGSSPSGAGGNAGTGNGSGGRDGGIIGAGGAAGTGTFGDACSSQTSESHPIVSDIFIMLDKSGSMNCAAADSACENPATPAMHPTRWEAFTQAVQSFVAAPSSDGIGVGLGYFSLDASSACNTAAYAQPLVPISPLPGSANAITQAVMTLTPAGNTPTVPALQGALQYATTYTRNTPGRSASVVLVTDGVPNGCNSTVVAAAMAAQAAFSGTPTIPTYVIGLGNTANLDQIALSGSGGAFHYFPAQGDIAGQLAAALAKISGVLTCDYVIPMTSTIDPLNVNIQVTVGAGATTLVGYVGSAASCGPNGGWYYDNPANPTHVTLCPQTCNPLQATPNSKVLVLYGCPRKGPGVD
jgi:hypothetical protein